MWPFDGRRKAEPQEFRRAFAKLLPDDVRPDYLRGVPSHEVPPRKEKLGFIVIQVRDDTVERAQAALTDAVERLTGCGFMREAIASPLVVGTIGHGFPNEPAVNETGALAKRIAAELGTGAKVVHGVREGVVGSLPRAQTTVWYGSIIPEFGRVLTALATQQFGSCIRI